MHLTALLALAWGLSMDAFSAAICKGMALKKATWRIACMAGLWFGVFQGGMLALGYALGQGFSERIAWFDHWIALIVLSCLGLNMLCDAGKQEKSDAALDAKTMLALSLATSLDALAAGVTLAFLQAQPLLAAGVVGGWTFALSAAGVRLGYMLGVRCKTLSERLGGGMLILTGLKIFLEHINAL